MKPIFFERNGWLVYPSTLVGLVLSWAAAVYDGFMFRYIDDHQHSGSDTLINFVPLSLIVLFIWYAVGFVFSRKKMS
jgi:hypothetical protein